jgi:hypothetical protein
LDAYLSDIDLLRRSPVAPVGQVDDRPQNHVLILRVEQPIPNAAFVGSVKNLSGAGGL